MRRILITGARGQVGFELQRALQPLGDVTAVAADRLDLSRTERVRSFLDDLRPDIIVNPAAYTAVDRAESEEPLARAVNADAVAVMAEHARASGALFIHYSTDYVFDGSKSVPYVASDSPNPLSAYGRTKLAGEQALAAAGCDYLCLRTSWVYAARGRNFLKTMLKLGGEREELLVVCDQIGAPTSARLLADVTGQVVRGALEERSAGTFRSELLHATASGATSWHGFAEAILKLARELSLGPLRAQRVLPIATRDYPTPARRPLNSRLDCSRIEDRFGIRLPPWEVGLRLCMEELA